MVGLPDTRNDLHSTVEEGNLIQDQASCDHGYPNAPNIVTVPAASSSWGSFRRGVHQHPWDLL